MNKSLADKVRETGDGTLGISYCQHRKNCAYENPFCYTDNCNKFDKFNNAKVYIIKRVYNRKQNGN